MKIDEVIIRPERKTWELMQNDALVSPIYNAYNEFSRKTAKFTIGANTIFDEYALTDLIVNYQTYKNALLEVFNEKDQVIKIIDRIISYLEYGELDE